MLADRKVEQRSRVERERGRGWNPRVHLDVESQLSMITFVTMQLEPVN